MYEHTTIGCSLKKFLIAPTDVVTIRDAVVRVHSIVVLGTELANFLLRKWLRDGQTEKLKQLFDRNFLMKVFNAVSVSVRKEKEYEGMREVRDTVVERMGTFVKPSRHRVLQCLVYEAASLETVALNNVWMHFGRRVRSHVWRYLDTQDQSNMTKRDLHKLCAQMTIDLCNTQQGTPLLSPAAWHAWIESERIRLDMVHDTTRPLLYQLKTTPHKFLRAMSIMSLERERAGGKSFSIYPLRRTLEPRHVRFDEKCLRDLLQLGSNPRYAIERATEISSVDVSTLEEQEQSSVGGVKRRRERKAAEDLVGEKSEFFGKHVNLRAVHIPRGSHFGFQFTTDGVCARVLIRRTVEDTPVTSAKKKKKKTIAGAEVPFPKRGIWTIDALKAADRQRGVHVIGIDPGKCDLIVAVDMDEAHRGKTRSERRGSRFVRYSQKRRRHDLHFKKDTELDNKKEDKICPIEASLAGTNSRSADLDTFGLYVKARRPHLPQLLKLYRDLGFRKRRWKRYIKKQASESNLCNIIRSLHEKDDTRHLVLAYGSWGLVAGRPGAACNKGNPPCIGVGLMRRLAKDFVVAPTPEAYTSKLCCGCGHECIPCENMEKERGKKIRGLRRCPNEDCKISFLNRDRNGATNIGTNFCLLIDGRPPIRVFDDQEFEIHQLDLQSRTNT